MFESVESMTSTTILGRHSSELAEYVSERLWRDSAVQSVISDLRRDDSVLTFEQGDFRVEGLGELVVSWGEKPPCNTEIQLRPDKGLCVVDNPGGIAENVTSIRWPIYLSGWLRESRIDPDRAFEVKDKLVEAIVRPIHHYAESLDRLKAPPVSRHC